MSASSAKANLMDAHKKLRLAWERARSSWSDENAALFQREVIDPLEGRINAAIKGVDHVVELMRRVRQECGDDGG
ncbi:MAG: hypothetical protein HRU70_01005 [Phycisphaeraceae bacterium]|nr:MAG: hypothetical protein HRU70_01005 [Phycisphaeraceae bacterium]